MSVELPSPEVFKVETCLDVRWGDMDALGHVNNSRYFSYCEEANFTWFDRVAPGQTLLSLPVYPVLARAECDFLSSIVHPTALRIHTRATKVGHSSLWLEHLLCDRAEGRPYARARLLLVFIQRDTRTPTAIPQDIRTRIQQLDGV